MERGPMRPALNLGETFIKKFQASAEDRTQPDPVTAWEIDKPKRCLK